VSVFRLPSQWKSAERRPALIWPSIPPTKKIWLRGFQYKESLTRLGGWEPQNPSTGPPPPGHPPKSLDGTRSVNYALVQTLKLVLKGRIGPPQVATLPLQTEIYAYRLSSPG